ncbi:MAG: hypothetical protein FWC13_07595 [Oscillospiraceae bacterium]|nr:hypothetical protein [Oscillospiraceae bacterium]
MSVIEVSIDTSGVDDALKSLKGIEKAIPKVLESSMNTTLKAMKPATIEIVRQTYTIQKSEVAKHLNIRDRATLSKPSVSLVSTGRPRSALKFHHRKNTQPGRKGGRPAFLMVKRGEGGHLSGDGSHSTAFVATMGSGRKSLFQRTGKIAGSEVKAYAASRKNVSRYNSRQKREVISQVWSPGVTQMLRNRVTKEEVQNHFSKLFMKNFDEEVSKILKEHGG